MLRKPPPSIFNDVIGPIMRGPSSSHTAASVRIGSLVRQFMGGDLKDVLFEFEPHGSLATTYSSQGSDIGLAAGLLNMDPTDERLTNALTLAPEKGITLEFQISDFPASHPNTYRVTASGYRSGEKHRLVFISTGGGMIELTEINGLPVNIRGDYYETLFFYQLPLNNPVKKLVKTLLARFPALDYGLTAEKGETGVLNLKSAVPLEKEIYAYLDGFLPGASVFKLEPVVPVGSHKDLDLPFHTIPELLKMAKSTGKELWELAVDYECARGKLAKDEVLKMAEEVIDVMSAAVDQGLAGTEYEDRILGPQAHKAFQEGRFMFGGGLTKKMIAYITAIMETKSAMGLIVAAPTAGACAGLPGTLLAALEELRGNKELLIKGLMASALIGVFIAIKSTFAAEECGCQAECGSGSAMAAAGLVQMAGGSVETALAASSMAMQNINGMVCDPVANRVEVPCLGKNILAGMNALASANMALAGFNMVIPLEQAIEAFDQVGRMLPPELRCTGKAGLSVTAASLALQNKLNN